MYFVFVVSFVIIGVSTSAFAFVIIVIVFFVVNFMFIICVMSVYVGMYMINLIYSDVMLCSVNVCVFVSMGFKLLFVSDVLGDLGLIVVIVYCVVCLDVCVVYC